MFLDYLYNLPNSTEGLDAIVVETSTSVPALAPLILAFVFFVIFLGGISRQKARSGTADYPMWSLVASLSIFILSLIMSIIEGLIRLEWLVVVFVITIFSALWFFLGSKPGEI